MAYSYHLIIRLRVFARFLCSLLLKQSGDTAIKFNNDNKNDPEISIPRNLTPVSWGSSESSMYSCDIFFLFKSAMANIE